MILARKKNKRETRIWYVDLQYRIRVFCCKIEFYHSSFFQRLLHVEKERTHRLCTRGGMLESFLQEPERLTDDDVMLLLKLIFHRQDTQELLKKLLEREKPETP